MATLKLKQNPSTPLFYTAAGMIDYLHLKGMSYREIAKRVGVSHAWIRKVINGGSASYHITQELAHLIVRLSYEGDQ